ncbi:hypothetical protein AH03_16 [Erwinia phage AH03]|uniref:Uncharacterized protein n=1 Tax=Erwinia phage AH03 TaxID=2869568 RepID=A0AAE7X090_9CAUD|nr:hypothetical protein AH03_16 [Erwinia phage AH03]
MKPHIYFNFGWWRVSPKPKPYHKHDELWNEAHAHCRKLNALDNGAHRLKYSKAVKVIKND